MPHNQSYYILHQVINNKLEKSVTGSQHMNGAAVDFNISSDLNDLRDGDQRTLSRAFYKFYREFRAVPNRLPLLYGSKYNARNSKYSLRKDRFVAPINGCR